MFGGNVHNFKIYNFFSDHFYLGIIKIVPPSDVFFVDIHGISYPFDQYIYIYILVTQLTRLINRLQNLSEKSYSDFFSILLTTPCFFG